ncbi:MAG: S24 family peptidase [Acidobacteriota bacterium]
MDFGLHFPRITISPMHAQTRRQGEVLDFIVRYIESHGYRPSYQVIARHMGVRSRAGIARIVSDLETQGLLTRRRENGHFYIDLGKRSGTANSAESTQIEWLDVPKNDEHDGDRGDSPFSLPAFMLGSYEPATLCAFRVTDDAMAGDHIFEDDIALIEVREFARDGQRVVAVLNKKDVILRKYYRAGSEIELRPGDDDGEVIRVAANRVEIKGVYRGLLRPAM